MDYQIRRKDRAVSREEALQILYAGEYGVLSLTSPDGSAYGLPISYACEDGYIYLHCAATGRKIDCLRFSPKVSFCVVGDTQPVYDSDFSTYYESAIVSGRAEFVEDETEKRRALTLLAQKYLPEHIDKAEGSISRAFDKVCVVRIPEENITGKAKRK